VTPVLLAEHDDAVAGMLARYLARDGLAVRLAASPELALASLARTGPADTEPEAVAVVDLTMPGLDPRRVRRALLSRAVPAPVIFLVARGPRPRGLNGAGARRWLVRPFAPRQLVVTIRELITGTSRDAEPQPATNGTNGTDSTDSTGPLQLDPGRRLALVSGQEVPLTGTEFAMLAAMLASPGRPKGRGQLLAAAGRTGSDRAADVHIAALRAKIGVPGLIRTVRGAGYALAEVTPALSWAATAAETEDEGAVAGAPRLPG
jgi:two-component system OmpR family response regulator